jgi:dTDP-3-amino-3,4,6-trideoxy-alpha-D-glucose transaminase
VATWLAVLHVGATPVPVDVSPVTGAWETDAVASAISSRTRVLLPVHLYGQPVDLDPLRLLAGRNGLAVLDDAAQAHGARYRGEAIGGLTHLTAWSFYPGKNLGALGDGGAVTTPDADLAARVRSLRNYGSTEKYVHDELGWNSRLDELQAALLRVKLVRLDEHNQRRARVAARYTEGLAGSGLATPATPDWATPAWHLYVVRTPYRDALRSHLAAQGVETGIHYPVPPHRQPLFAGTALAEAYLPAADALAREVLSLPMGPTLSASDQDRVIDAIWRFRR